MSEQLQVIGVGSPLVDILAHVSEEFVVGVPGEKGGMELVDAQTSAGLIARLDSPKRVPGGSAANTIFGLARLGTQCAFLGKLGEDDAGEFYRSYGRDCGLDVSRFKTTRTTPTGQVCCMVTPDSQRTFRTFLGAASELQPDEVSVADFSGVGHMHLEGYLLFNRDLTNAILAAAKKAGCTISLDLASFEVVQANADVLEGLLDTYIDMVFANEDEAKAFTGDENPEANLALLSRHCHTAVVKVGADGAWLKRGDESARVEAERVEAIDTTGAGDLWAAGFLYGHFTGKDLATCGQYGSIVGAEVVQILGASISDERWIEIRKRLS